MSKNNHVWPAYVDMMTVLLLVYLIINAMYSALLANADLDPRNKKVSDDVTESTSHGVINDRDIEMMKSYQQLYNNEPGDLSINLDKEQYALYPGDIKKIIAWLTSHPANGEKYKYDVGVFLNDNSDETSGLLLRRQTIIYYQILSVMKNNNIPLDLINNRNAAPNPDYGNVIKLRYSEK